MAVAGSAGAGRCRDRRFVAAVRDAGVRLIGLNFFAGDLAGADCGVLSIPARSAEFRDNIAVTMGIGEALGVAAFNALYGNRVSDVTPEQQDDLATENLTLARQGGGRHRRRPSWSSRSAAPSHTRYGPLAM